MTRTSHYEADLNKFILMSRPDAPSWREPQLGALAALMAHWAIDPTIPGLVSMPTGSGKTAVAVAVPYLARSHRVLVVVPSTDLRTQIAEQFRTEQVLRSIGALSGSFLPKVHELTGRSLDWAELEAFDVIVALPNSVSPSHFVEGREPAVDYFDMVIVDEAHHAPASTWRSILDYFKFARSVLLTATPTRRDGKALPGAHLFHYPLKKAIVEGIFKPVVPHLLRLGSTPTLEEKGRLIAEKVVSLAQSDLHSNSAVLIRASSISRANTLHYLYTTLGLEARLVHSKVPAGEREDILATWRAGSLKAVIAVDMLGEGIDLPNLRIVGYHDKHKSVRATVQLIGRLARVSAAYPQPSELVTALDSDVYPAIQSAVRALYAEDSEWAVVLPQLIDDEIQEEKLNREFLSGFDQSPPTLSLAAISPLARLVILESRGGVAYQPSFASGTVPAGLEVGDRIAGQSVVYSGISASPAMLVVLTAAKVTPAWYRDDPGLDSPQYDLHVATWHPASRAGLPDLIFLNTHDKAMFGAIRAILDPDERLRKGSASSLHAAFESQIRVSVSSVGVRNTYVGGPGTTTYAMFSGKAVDMGLREADTNSRALGHAMAQIETDTGVTTAGFASAKSKYWEVRYMDLRKYAIFAATFADRYWFPSSSTSGPLLPDVARGEQTVEFPLSEVLLVEMNPKLVGNGWKLSDGTPLEEVELKSAGSGTRFDLQLLAVASRQPDNVIWQGDQSVDGSINTTFESMTVSRGFGQQLGIGELLEIEPPNIYFLDGSTIHGGMRYTQPGPGAGLPDLSYTAWDWSGTDIQTEAKRAGRSDTIHDRVEQQLLDRGKTKRLKWVLCNDGSGEIADHIVIEIDPYGRPRVELWHSKPASGSSPSVRVDDLQVVTQQAIKSRRFIADRDFWKRLGKRLDGEEAPRAVLVGGDSLQVLRALCGRMDWHKEWSIADKSLLVEGKIVIVQPGLSLTKLNSELGRSPIPISAGQVREFLTVLHNSTQGRAAVEIVSS